MVGGFLVYPISTGRRQRETSSFMQRQDLEPGYYHHVECCTNSFRGVNAQQTITDAVHFPQVFQDEFMVKMIRQLSSRLTGKQVAFNATGYIYTKTLPDNGKAHAH